MLNEVLMFVSAGSTCTAIHYAIKAGRMRNSLAAFDRYCLDLSNQLATKNRENHAMRTKLDAQQAQRVAAAKRAGELNRARAEKRRLKRVRATARAMRSWPTSAAAAKRRSPMGPRCPRQREDEGRRFPLGAGGRRAFLPLSGQSSHTAPTTP